MRILVLTSSTGGGHDMRARSLKQWAEGPELIAGCECRIVQALESTHGLYRFGVSLYNWIQRTSPRLHHVYFNVLEVLGATRRRGNLLGKERFAAVLRDFKPDVIVSTHAHLNHAFFDVAKEVLGRERVRCVTYCGELYGGYGFARGWVNPKADAFIGAVDSCCEAARALGMPEAKIFRGGFLLHPDFFRQSAPREKEDLFEELRLDPSRFTLLLGTGANGANNHRRCIEACIRAKLRIQIIALCGKDESARKNLERIPLPADGPTVRALGYTNEMPRLLRSVSAVFARPGTGTTSEAIVSGCPIVFNAIGGVMPQENITVRYARKQGIWLANVRRPGQLPEIVQTIQTSQRLDKIRLRMKKIHPGRPRELLATITACAQQKQPVNPAR